MSRHEQHIAALKRAQDVIRTNAQDLADNHAVDGEWRQGDAEIERLYQSEMQAANDLDAVIDVLRGDPTIGDLQLLADIREAAGDPHGMLMQPELVERIERLRAAVDEYANPFNWSDDAHGIRRVWLEPGSGTPDAYNGFEMARAAKSGGRG